LNEAAAGELAKTRDADFQKAQRVAVLRKKNPAPLNRGVCVHGQDRTTQYCALCDRVAA
jgi:hypothetical protein